MKRDPGTAYEPALCRGFRWVKPAASLKPGWVVVVAVGMVPLFPLGKTGGLIEAPNAMNAPSSYPPCFRWVKPAASLKRTIAGSSMLPVSTGFPLGKTGGLIEAWSARQSRPRLSGFPLGKTGGLIEAAYRGAVRVSRAGGFRWVKPAASLKHGRNVAHAAHAHAVSAG